MTKAQRVCEALDLKPEVLADLCKREAARLLRVEAQLVETHWAEADPTRLLEPQHWLRLAQLFEAEYERRMEAEADRRDEPFQQLLGDQEGDGGPAVGGESLRTDPTATTPEKPSGWRWRG